MSDVIDDSALSYSYRICRCAQVMHLQKDGARVRWVCPVCRRSAR